MSRVEFRAIRKQAEANNVDPRTIQVEGRKGARSVLNASITEEMAKTRPDGFKVVFTEGVEFLGPDGSPVDPTSGCDVEDIIWATFNVYRSSGKITMPESMCRILCQDTRRYVGHLLDLI